MYIDFLNKKNKKNALGNFPGILFLIIVPNFI